MDADHVAFWYISSYIILKFWINKIIFIKQNNESKWQRTGYDSNLVRSGLRIS